MWLNSTQTHENFGPVDSILGTISKDVSPHGMEVQHLTLAADRCDYDDASFQRLAVSRTGSTADPESLAGPSRLTSLENGVAIRRTLAITRGKILSRKVEFPRLRTGCPWGVSLPGTWNVVLRKVRAICSCNCKSTASVDSRG